MTQIGNGWHVDRTTTRDGTRDRDETDEWATGAAGRGALHAVRRETHYAADVDGATRATHRREIVQ